jgi:HEAT repeat protein
MPTCKKNIALATCLFLSVHGGCAEQTEEQARRASSAVEESSVGTEHAIAEHTTPEGNETATEIEKPTMQTNPIDDERFTALIAALHNTGGNEEEFEAAIKAAQDLEKLEDRTRLPELYGLLKDTDDFFVRENVGIAIAKMEGLTALPELLVAIRADGHDYDGLVAHITWIVEDNSAKSASLLLAMLESGTQQERHDAAWLLGYVAETITPDPLIAELDSDDEKLRGIVVGSLGSFSDDPKVFALLKRLAIEDNNEQVRRSAVSALALSRDPAAAASVIKAATNDRSEYVRGVAEWAVEHLQREE